MKLCLSEVYLCFAGKQVAFAGISMRSAGKRFAFAGILLRFAGKRSTFAGILLRFAGILPHSAGNQIIPAYTFIP
ncbi:hypothetical protein LS41612_19915 [Lysinibacillus sphaericus]|uniref:Uncharacterized protein n=1 Tax=Lysinibacillus sphaericus TaxID=1421 RepID=A0A2S0K4W3_LYSSH|nr:hypothetical protein LS41612_19915 [Lysinibacillus sphaericus]